MGQGGAAPRELKATQPCVKELALASLLALVQCIVFGRLTRHAGASRVMCPPHLLMLESVKLLVPHRLSHSQCGVNHFLCIG
jgi:hypothetical protein